MRFRGVAFDDLADGGRVLAAALDAEVPDLPPDAVVLAVLLGGAPVAAVIAETRRLAVAPVRIVHGADDFHAELVGVEPSALAGRTLLVVDAGVQSGESAQAAVTLARSLRPAQLIFAVPICHAQAAADLVSRVDVFVAPHRPFTPRTLRWEYKSFDVPADEATALAMLEPLGLL